jgi:hypothetical protein
MYGCQGRVFPGGVKMEFTSGRMNRYNEDCVLYEYVGLCVYFEKANVKRKEKKQVLDKMKTDGLQGEYE